MKTTTGFLAFLALALLAVSSCALEIDILVPESFSEGETLGFDFTITPDFTENLTYIPIIYCPQIGLTPISEKQIAVVGDVPYHGSYTVGEVTSRFEPQDCVATVSANGYNVSESAAFRIVTKPSLDLNISVCKDATCSMKPKVFIMGEPMHLGYSSDAPDPQITATLLLPDGTEQHLSLPAEIMPSALGVYTLTVVGSAEGYKSVIQKKTFAVIPRNARIGYVNETTAAPVKVPASANNGWVLLLIVILSAVLAVYLLKQQGLLKLS